mgnify:CR=1 FL=1
MEHRERNPLLPNAHETGDGGDKDCDKGMYLTGSKSVATLTPDRSTVPSPVRRSLSRTRKRAAENRGLGKQR